MSYAPAVQLYAIAWIVGLCVALGLCLVLVAFLVGPYAQRQRAARIRRLAADLLAATGQTPQPLTRPEALRLAREIEDEDPEEPWT